jgi:hypothetical protein
MRVGAPTPASQQTGIPFETPSHGFYLNLAALSAEDGQTGAFWLGAAPPRQSSLAQKAHRGV